MGDFTEKVPGVTAAASADVSGGGVDDKGHKRRKASRGTGRGRVNGKRSPLPAVAAVALVFSLAAYGSMVYVERQALSDYDKGTTYVATSDIPKGTVVSPSDYGQWFSEIVVDQKMIPNCAINSPEDVVEMAAVYGIEQGTLLTSGMFEPVSDILAGIEDPVLAGFRSDDLYQAVNGVLRAGDRIDVYSVKERYDTYSEKTVEAVKVWDGLYVQGVFDSSGAAISTTDGITSAYRVNIYLGRDDVSQFYEELAKGSLRVVKSVG